MSADLTPAQRKRGIAAAIAIVSVAGMGLMMLTPLLSLSLERMGVSSTTIGAFGTVAAISTLTITPFVPRLLRAFGAVRLLVGAVAVSIGCILLFPSFPNVWVWFPLRFVNSAALILLFVLSEIWINQLAEDHNRGRILGVYAACFSFGAAFGPWLLYQVGTDGFTPFGLAAALMLLATLPLFFVRGVTPVLHEESKMTFRAFVVIAPIAYFAALSYGAIEMALLGLLPVYAVRNGFTHGSAALLLTFYGVGNMLLQMPIGWLSDHVNRRVLLLGCAAVGVVGALALPTIIGMGGVAHVMVLAWGGVIAGMYTVGLAIVADRFKGSDLAAANSAFIFVYGIGMLVGPGSAGAAMDVWVPHGLAYVLTGLFAIYLLVGGVALWRNRATLSGRRHRREAGSTPR